VKIFVTTMSLVLLSSMAILFTACGYKQSSKYARAIIGESVSTSVTISPQDPENTVLIKDAVDSAIIEVFHASLTTKNLSESHLDLSIGDPSYSPIQYDSDGYIIAYRATISMNIVRHKKEISKKYVTQGSYDFSVVANAVLTDQERFDAIRFSASKALKSFISHVSAEGARK